MLKYKKFNSFSEFLEKFEMNENTTLFYTKENQACLVPKVDFISIEFKSGEIGISIYEKKLTKKELDILKQGHRKVSKTQIKNRKLPIVYYVGDIKPRYKKGQVFKSSHGNRTYTILNVANSPVKRIDKDRYSYLLKSEQGLMPINEKDLHENLKEGNVELIS